MKKIALGLLLVVLLGACSQQPKPNAELSAQAGYWQKLGGALDFTAAKSAVAPQLVLDRSGKLVVVWLEDGKVYLERWTGTGWQSFGQGFPIKVGLISIAFDRTNSPVIITPASSENGTINGCGGDSIVVRRDSKTGIWSTIKTLPAAARGLTSDKDGFVYIVVPDVNKQTNEGFHRILRWDGQTWKSFSSFLPRNSSGQPYIVGVCNISLDNIGRLVLISRGSPSPQYDSSFHSYNGTAWQYTAGYDSTWDIFYPFAFDKQNKITTNQLLNGGQQIIQGTQKIGDPFFDRTITGITVDSTNRPLVASVPYDGEEKGNVFIKRWTGSTWENLGGVLDRIPSRFAAVSLGTYAKPLLVDSQGTIYVVWSECFGTYSESLGCSNWNVYVSKYVP